MLALRSSTVSNTDSSQERKSYKVPSSTASSRLTKSHADHEISKSHASHALSRPSRQVQKERILLIRQGIDSECLDLVSTSWVFHSKYVASYRRGLLFLYLLEIYIYTQWEQGNFPVSHFLKKNCYCGLAAKGHDFCLFNLLEKSKRPKCRRRMDYYA